MFIVHGSFGSVRGGALTPALGCQVMLLMLLLMRPHSGPSLLRLFVHSVEYFPVTEEPEESTIVTYRQNREQIHEVMGEKGGLRALWSASQRAQVSRLNLGVAGKC